MPFKHWAQVLKLSFIHSVVAFELWELYWRRIFDLNISINIHWDISFKNKFYTRIISSQSLPGCRKRSLIMYYMVTTYDRGPMMRKVPLVVLQYQSRMTTAPVAISFGLARTVWSWRSGENEKNVLFLGLRNTNMEELPISFAFRQIKGLPCSTPPTKTSKKLKMKNVPHQLFQMFSWDILLSSRKCFIRCTLLVALAWMPNGFVISCEWCN